MQRLSIQKFLGKHALLSLDSASVGMHATTRCDSSPLTNKLEYSSLTHNYIICILANFPPIHLTIWSLCQSSGRGIIALNHRQKRVGGIGNALYISMEICNHKCISLSCFFAWNKLFVTYYRWYGCIACVMIFHIKFIRGTEEIQNEKYVYTSRF